ncbi:MAG: hypothetical protein IJ113_06075 [Eggerthellaceae bacterium]|nr:hypothetical protein [Eggerthellaceae bacterium]
MYGSDIETPTVTTSAEVKPGDTVTVEWRNNSLHILGNTSEPATSSSRVKTMLEPVEEIAQAAYSTSGEAMDASQAAHQAAEEAQDTAEAINQHFWHRSTDPDQDGAGTGAFVTDEEQTTFLEAIASGIEPTVLRPLHNLLMNAEGILLRAAKKIRAAFTPSGVSFYDGKWDGTGDGSSHVVATFGTNGARIGRDGNNEYNVTLESDLFAFKKGSGYLISLMSSEVIYEGKTLAQPTFEMAQLGLAEGNAGFLHMSVTDYDNRTFSHLSSLSGVKTNNPAYLELVANGAGGSSVLQIGATSGGNKQIYYWQFIDGYTHLPKPLGVGNGGTGVGTATKNQVFAAPTSQNGAPGFRALVANDLPTVPVNKGGTGQSNANDAARALGMAKTAGDTISMSGYVATGYLTSSKTKMTLTVATPFRFYDFTGATATATATVRQNNLYLFGSTSSAAATLSNL